MMTLEPWTYDEDGNALLFSSAERIAEIAERIRQEEAEIDWERDHPIAPDDWSEQVERANAEHEAIAAAERRSIEEARRWEEEMAAEFGDEIDLF